MIYYYSQEQRLMSIAVDSQSPVCLIYGKEYSEDKRNGKKSNWDDAFIVHQDDLDHIDWNGFDMVSKDRTDEIVEEAHKMLKEMELDYLRNNDDEEDFIDFDDYPL